MAQKILVKHGGKICESSPLVFFHHGFEARENEVREHILVPHDLFKSILSFALSGGVP